MNKMFMNSNYIETSKLEDAEIVFILENPNRLSGLELYTSYPLHIDFNGEYFIRDEHGKNNYGFYNCYRVCLYKNKKNN